jgi:hypothetical protein
MLSDALGSFIQIFSPPVRTVMWKSVCLTAIVLFLLGLGLDRLASSLMPAAPTWLSWILSIVVALGLIASLTLLAAPTASLLPGRYRRCGGTRDRSPGPSGMPVAVTRFALCGTAIRHALPPRQPRRAGADTLRGCGVRRLLRPQWLSARAGIFRTGRHAPSAFSASR